MREQGNKVWKLIILARSVRRCIRIRVSVVWKRRENTWTKYGWRVRTELLKYLIVVRKHRLGLLPARIRSFCKKPGVFVRPAATCLPLHGQLLMFKAGRNSDTCFKRQRRRRGGCVCWRPAGMWLTCPPVSDRSKKTTCHLFKLHHTCLVTLGLQTQAPGFIVAPVQEMNKRRKWGFDGAVPGFHFPSWERRGRCFT